LLSRSTIGFDPARSSPGPLGRGIDSKLTSKGKDERAISVSGYVHQGLVKYTDHAFNKVIAYKQNSRNHLLHQIESFRVGDNKSDREDDLLDTFCYGIAISMGNSEGLERIRFNPVRILRWRRSWRIAGV
jgi:hypothetical protein